MSDLARSDPPLTATGASSDGRPDPIFTVKPPAVYLDGITILGFALSIALIMSAILMGSGGANFIDLPSVLIVVLGTTCVTIISYTSRELRLAWPVIMGSAVRTVYEPRDIAREILTMAIIARKRGLLGLSAYTRELRNNPFLESTTQMAIDGMTADEIHRLTSQDIDIVFESYRKASGVLRRASEISPAMGLIGTLVGLVQMLVALDDPSKIGPAMALALLTTFYGAIMGTIILAPLAAKLDRNGAEEVLGLSLIQSGVLSIVRQENPRKLEMELNSLLPPDQRIRYFEL